VQKLKNMKFALMVVTKENEEWVVKYETLAKDQDGEFKVAAFQKQWEDNQVRLTCVPSR